MIEDSEFRASWIFKNTYTEITASNKWVGKSMQHQTPPSHAGKIVTGTKEKGINDS